MAFEQSFSREGLTTIEVELRRGDVVVEEASDDQIGVEATLSSGASDGDLKITIDEAERLLATSA